MTHDVVVVGLGGVGSATAAVLARRGQRVLGLDRHPPAHDQGASHGESRIVRTAYFEGADYVPLLRRAVELWDGLGLLRRTGGLFLGAPGSRVLEGSRQTAEQWDLPHELLTGAEVTARYPAITPPGDTVALHERTAGVVCPEDAVRTQLAAATAAGADLRHGVVVTGWEPTPQGVSVRSSAGTFQAGAVVLAPGRWTAELADGLPLTVERRVMHWFAAGPGFGADEFPVWIWERPDGTVPYGVPELGTGVKASVHHSALRPPADWTPAELADLLAPLLPALGGTVLRSVDCTYTLTPDEHPVLGRHPVCDRVLLACGFSGHGFKLTPVLGEVLADLTTGASGFDLSLFDPLRARAGSLPSPPAPMSAA